MTTHRGIAQWGQMFNDDATVTFAAATLDRLLHKSTMLRLGAMSFRQRMVALRKERGLTQQKLADIAGLHVCQIRKYETNAAQPSVDAVKKLAVALSVPTDVLLFDEGERGPDDDLRLEFEAMARLDPDERRIVKAVIESVVVKHDVRRVGLQAGAG